MIYFTSDQEQVVSLEPLAWLLPPAPPPHLCVCMWVDGWVGACLCACMHACVCVISILIFNFIVLSQFVFLSEFIGFACTHTHTHTHTHTRKCAQHMINLLFPVLLFIIFGQVKRQTYGSQIFTFLYSLKRNKEKQRWVPVLRKTTQKIDKEYCSKL